MRREILAVLVVSLMLLFWFVSPKEEYRTYIDLSGEWLFSVDYDNKGIIDKYQQIRFSDKVTLPGTTDTNQKGKENTDKTCTTNLSRKFTYTGPAWYKRDVIIPTNWENKHIELMLERTRPSMLWIDNNFIGERTSLSAPHRYDISSYLTPGKHSITLRIDNGESIPPQIVSNSHACTESTQTNWNGIIGKIELLALNKTHITSVNVYPDSHTKKIKVNVSLSDCTRLKGKSVNIEAISFNSKLIHKVSPQVFELNNESEDYSFEYDMGNEALLWSDINPNLYKLKVSIGELDKVETIFGLRDFKAENKHFTINGNKTFLRGKHDACVFPLTGHTAMDKEQWIRYFSICKEYGLNHCRFHSWCPPAACFEAADIVGIYLQPELPIWGEFSNEEDKLMSFLKSDGENIMHEYSNHASFVMFALGNELWGETEIMTQFVDHFRKIDNRHLYALGSNIYLGWKGHIPGEDFLVTCRVGGSDDYSSHARASFSFADAEQGDYLNNTYPNCKNNFDKALSNSPVPVIGHETGQYQIYPDYKEIEKYKGVLNPHNFEIFRDRLTKAGMADKAEEMFRASGEWAVKLYRADIEMNLRSADMAGFQLLDLQDYPGQGSAYVGILDAFMDSKGLISPKQWRNFCCEVVPLAIYDKYCYTEGEYFNAELKISNYSLQRIENKTLKWQLRNDNKLINQGSFNVSADIGLSTLGEININLPSEENAYKAILSILIEGTPYRNEYPVWIYPKNNITNNGDVIITDFLSDKIKKALDAGQKVLLIPEKDKCREVTVGGLFQTDYWNYRMFKTISENAGKEISPGTMGIMTNPDHHVFLNFPTSSHTDWQWYQIAKNSYPLILDAMPENYYPIIQVIDNIERNHKLGLLFESRVSNGKLMVLMSDTKEICKTPEGRQFYKSVIDYMNSDQFLPEFEFSFDKFTSFFIHANTQKDIEKLKNISYK